MAVGALVGSPHVVRSDGTSQAHPGGHSAQVATDVWSRAIRSSLGFCTPQLCYLFAWGSASTAPSPAPCWPRPRCSASGGPDPAPSAEPGSAADEPESPQSQEDPADSKGALDTYSLDGVGRPSLPIGPSSATPLPVLCIEPDLVSDIAVDFPDDEQHGPDRQHRPTDPQPQNARPSWSGTDLLVIEFPRHSSSPQRRRTLMAHALQLRLACTVPGQFLGLQPKGDILGRLVAGRVPVACPLQIPSIKLRVYGDR